MRNDDNIIKLLIIDDDVQLCTSLAELLSENGYQVTAVNDGETGLNEALTQKYEIIILDVMLPKINGFRVLKKIKPAIPTPVLMLTTRSDEVDRIVGLEKGADDYLPKPFNMRELLLRLKNILKHYSIGDTKEILTIGSLKLDYDQKQVYLSDTELKLTNTEFRLLRELMTVPGETLPRELLSQVGLGRDLSPYDRSLDVHMAALRNKLRKNTGTASPIRCVRGEGYFIVKDWDF